MLVLLDVGAKFEVLEFVRLGSVNYIKEAWSLRGAAGQTHRHLMVVHFALFSAYLRLLVSWFVAGLNLSVLDWELYVFHFHFGWFMHRFAAFWFLFADHNDWCWQNLHLYFGWFLNYDIVIIILWIKTEAETLVISLLFVYHWFTLCHVSCFRNKCWWISIVLAWFVVIWPQPICICECAIAFFLWYWHFIHIKFNVSQSVVLVLV